MVTTVNFDQSPATEYSVAGATVWLRERWGDEWVEQTGLFATTIIWNVAPQLSSATFVWRYGRRIDGSEEAFVEPLAKGRHYVKIEVGSHGIGDVADEDAVPMVWIGTLEVEADDRRGYADAEKTKHRGRQELVAHGLGGLLDRAPLIQSFVENTHAPFGIALPIGRGLTFNAGGRPNRSTAKDEGHYVFAGDEATAEHWSTRDCVEYLLFASPLATLAGELPLKLDATAAGQLPDWDKPVIDTHGKTLWDLLNELIPRQRLLGWFLEVDEANEVRVKPFTFAPEAIELDAGTLEANDQQKVLIFDESVDGVGIIKITTADTYDQIIVQGARRRSCFSICDDNGTLVKGWTSALETAYEAGASGAGDYPAAAEWDERRRRDADARRAAKFEDVFARFRLPDDWDGKAGDPIAGGAADEDVFPDDRPPEVSFPHLPELAVLATLPLLSGHDYSGTHIADGTVAATGDDPGREITPQVFFELPEHAGQFVHGESISTVAALVNPDTNRSFSCVVRTRERDHGVNVVVIGGEQHLIATTDFDALATDLDPGDESHFDWQLMVLTVAVYDERYAEARSPSDIALLMALQGAAQDVARRLLIDAGDGYKLDYVVPGTIVSVDPATSEPQQSTGGYVNDDRDELQALANLAYAWYGVPRKSLTFNVNRPNTALWLGDLVTEVGDAAPVPINSVITQIHLRLPLTEGHEPTPPGPVDVSYTTAYGELDPLQFG